MEINKIEILF